MNFLTPALLGLALLAVPVIVAFLSRKKVEKKLVPSLVILKHLEQGAPRRRSFSMPRNLLALLLYLLAVIAMVLASSQPVFQGEEPRDVLIVLDASYSMGASTGGEESMRYIDLARQDIRTQILDNLGPRDRAALIVADVDRQVQVDWTRDLSRHDDALRDVQVAGSQAQVSAALRLGQAMCASGERKTELVFVTDVLGEQRIDRMFGRNTCAYSVLRVAEDTTRHVEHSNLAVSALVARQVDALGEYEVYVEVLNASTEARDVVVEVELDGVVAEVLSLGVGAGRREGKLFKLDVDEGHVLRARIVGDNGELLQGDALLVDNEAYAVLEERAWVDVLLVSSREFSFVGQAFKLHPRVRLNTMKPEDVSAEDLVGQELVVVEDSSPGLDVLSVARDGGFVWWVGPQDGTPVKFNSIEVERPVAGWWDFGHELFRYVDLDDVEILSAQFVVREEGDDLLMTAGQNQALMLMRKVGDGDLLVSAFHPEQSDLVLRVGFVNMVANMVELLASKLEVKRAHVLEPGDSFASVGAYERLEDIESVWGPLSVSTTGIARASGVWRLGGGARDGEYVIVKIDEFDEFEMASSSMSEEVVRFDRDAFSEKDRGAKLIKVLLMLACAAMCLEGLWFWFGGRGGSKKSASGLRQRLSEKEDER